jgi:hypothetical protein
VLGTDESVCFAPHAARVEQPGAKSEITVIGNSSSSSSSTAHVPDSFIVAAANDVVVVNGVHACKYYGFSVVYFQLDGKGDTLKQLILVRAVCA